MKDASTKIEKSNEAHVFIRHSSKLHLDQTGKFQHTSRSGKQCLTIMCIVDANIILSAPFKNKTSQQLTETYLKLNK